MYSRDTGRGNGREGGGGGQLRPQRVHRRRPAARRRARVVPEGGGGRGSAFRVLVWGCRRFGCWFGGGGGPEEGGRCGEGGVGADEEGARVRGYSRAVRGARGGGGGGVERGEEEHVRVEHPKPRNVVHHRHLLHHQHLRPPRAASAFCPPVSSGLTSRVRARGGGTRDARRARACKRSLTWWARPRVEPCSAHPPARAPGGGAAQSGGKRITCRSAPRPETASLCCWLKNVVPFGKCYVICFCSPCCLMSSAFALLAVGQSM